jgi:hypothetical protein
MGPQDVLPKGLVIAINHEPLSFLRRAGYACVDQEKLFLDDHAEENVRRLAESGCDLVRMHFYKGFGLEAEQEEMELTREYVKTCHRHGLKVQLYVQVGTFQYETLLAEQPGMREWVQTDDDGRPLTLVYGHQAFRWYPCFNRPGAWDYLERVIRIGIEEFGADAIGFDNISTSEEPSVCHCESCRAGFVRWLKGKYRPDTAEGRERTRERFGHPLLDHVRPPVWNYFNHPLNLTEIKNPVIQEWVFFRCESLHRVLKRLFDYSKGLNPEVLLEFNAYKQSGTNTAFVHGIWLPDLQDCMDAFWNECDPQPEWTTDGRLLHKVRGFKVAEALGKAVFTNHPYEGPVGKRHLSYAESMTFNGGLIGGVQSAAALYGCRESAFRPYRDFARAYPEIYSANSAAAVALFESRTSLSFSNYDAHAADIAMHQALLRSHVPYDIVLDLDSLPRYRAVILAGAKCLAAAEISALAGYVRAGGGLILTGESGDCDEWARERGASALKSILGVPLPAAGSAGTVHMIEPGNGRVAFLPQLTLPEELDRHSRSFRPFDVNQPMVGLDSWRAPLETASVTDAVRWVLRDALPVEVDAPPHVVVELRMSSAERTAYLHLLNYRAGDTEEHVRVRFSLGSIVREIRCLSPDSVPVVTVAAESDGWFRLPALRCYLVACAAVSP